MTTDQVLLGVGLIVVLAVGSQVLAGRLRIPALIIFGLLWVVIGWLLALVFSVPIPPVPTPSSP